MYYRHGELPQVTDNYGHCIMPKTVLKDFMSSHNEKPIHLTVTGSFDEIIPVLRPLPKGLSINMGIVFRVRNPESGWLEHYQLPVLSADAGQAARKTLDGLFNQTRLTQQEYNAVQTKLDVIEGILKSLKAL